MEKWIVICMDGCLYILDGLIDGGIIVTEQERKEIVAEVEKSGSYNC
ncbi:hypothetical protein [[Ruminococcus] lactaris]|nr:hypothetical protein [[Ruminococcus] lactaris]